MSYKFSSSIGRFRRFSALSLLLLVLALCFHSSAAQPSASAATVPLFFETAPTNSGAQFFARGQAYQFLLNPNQAFMALRKVKTLTGRAAQRAAAANGAVDLYSERGAKQLFTRVVRMSFVGADPNAAMTGGAPMPTKVNYLIGNDPRNWRAGVTTFSQVRVDNLYPGVQMVYHGSADQLQFDFTVAPGGDPGVIAIRFDGVTRLTLNSEGDLIISLGPHQIIQPRPTIYQLIGGAEQAVTGGYVLKGPRTVQFSIGNYDRSLPLVIDPSLSYSSYFGGNSSDLALAVKVDTNGFVYVAGQTISTKFPFPLPPGGFSQGFQGGRVNGDGFVAKFDNTASNLLYFTYLGGSKSDAALDLAVDAAGHAFVTGFTDSPDFPVTNAVFPTIGGGRSPTFESFATDAFVSELNETGSGFVYSTYLGGTLADRGIGIAVDPIGNTYVTGFTFSSNFPVTVSTALQTRIAGSNDVFVAKFATNGSALLYSTYLGGTNLDEGTGIAADAAGLAYITGYTASTNFPVTSKALQTNINTQILPARFYKGKKVPLDAFVTVIDTAVLAAPNQAPTNGASLRYSTYLGGTNNDTGFRLALDANSNIYVTGRATPPDFPNASLLSLRNGTNKSNADAFLTKLAFASDSASMAYSVLFGGSTNDVGWDVAVDSAGNAFVVGITISRNFPTNNGSGFLRNTNTGHADVFVTAFNTNASALLYSGYIGGKQNDYGYGIAVDALGNAFVVGQTSSKDFPFVGGIQSTRYGTNDAFLAKISMQTVTITPSLAVERLPGGTLKLSWPAAARDFVLESTPSLSPPVWTLVPQTPVLSGGAFILNVPATHPTMFFRLRKSS
ncbi:MAG TPA: SBBP repeat-containing protein [Candidatus Dormibacteraeota bacterium]|nr:SBBP repeat-containing protein [Candidatus Dormibacteraeota bacterium]